MTATVNRKQLHDLTDAIETSEFNILYQLLIKFILEDTHLADIIEAIQTGHGEKLAELFETVITS